MAKVIVRTKGGLGNQLFCYATARRLALINDSELVIDDVSGFVRDSKYGRKYMLDHFHIPARKATKAERLEPFERYRRAVAKWLARLQRFEERKYLEQEGCDFDERLLNLKVKGTLYLDGLWQCEAYFKDQQGIINKDLQFIPPVDAKNQRMAEKIGNNISIAIHMRWYDAPDGPVKNNISVDYYQRAIKFVEEKFPHAHYFLFSDKSEAAQTTLALPASRSTVVSHNRGDELAYADLWLMSQCKHFIIANSTFSWWGAWLSNFKHKVVITPRKRNHVTDFSFRVPVPEAWIQL